jgi:sugar phosphate permease
MNKSESSGSGIGFLFILFLILKLTGAINCSWWWVTSPLWIPFALAFSLGFVVIIIAIIALLLFDKPRDMFINKIKEISKKAKQKNKKEDIEEEHED